VANPLLLRETNDTVARLTLNRPDKFNALSEELLAELKTALSDIMAPIIRTCFPVALK